MLVRSYYARFNLVTVWLEMSSGTNLSGDDIRVNEEVARMDVAIFAKREEKKSEEW